MTVIDQNKENLDVFIQEKDKDIAILYGRSGMGKTTYLKNLLKKYDGFYFNAYSATVNIELSLLYKTFCYSVEKSYKKSKDNLTLEYILDEITAYAEGVDKSYLFIIDNFVEFVKASNDFNKILQNYVQNKWVKSNIRLIVCSDSFLGVDKYLFSKKSVWKKEKKCIILFDCIPFSKAYRYLNCKNNMEYILKYGITGGIPELIYNANIVKNNMEIDNKTGKCAFLEKCFPIDKYNKSNIEYVMKNDLRELSYYNSLLSILSDGYQRVNDISDVFNKPKDIVVPYLKTLIKLNLVKKETPVTERLNRRKTRYSISNSSDIFWYKFIVKEMPYIENHLTYPEFQKDELIKFKKRVFIDICKEYLMKQSENSKLPINIKEIGNWWKNNDEKRTTVGFDIVGVGEIEQKEAFIFSRCFCKSTKVELSELKDLIELTKKMKKKGENYYIVFSVTGFDENSLTAAKAIKNIILVDFDKILSYYNNENNQ